VVSQHGTSCPLKRDREVAFGFWALLLACLNYLELLVGPGLASINFGHASFARGLEWGGSILNDSVVLALR
jgi:hypothetical protein